MSKEQQELPEDIEIVGPGHLLTQAREALNMTQADVAEKLNFRIGLVNDIEHEVFDKSIPATFNRGYLTNYAKLVGISVDDVLSSYEMLNVAEKQGAEMQSFSKITEKQAQHSIVMWISYLIVAALVASTVVYWLQDSKEANQSSAQATPENLTVIKSNSRTPEQETSADEVNNSSAALENEQTSVSTNISQIGDKSPEISEGNVENIETLELNAEPLDTALAELSDTELVEVSIPAVEPETLTAIFTFAGDCWVNINDANGERIAWGIKKAGYVMELNGIPPFQVTVGKPELVAIRYNGQTVDMSQFSVGNIAKFSLPESP